MATASTTAAKVAKLREMAKDKSLPQDVRNTYLDEAVKLEEKSAKESGVKLAKGGMAKKPAPKKMAGGGAVTGAPMGPTTPSTPMAKDTFDKGYSETAKEAKLKQMAAAQAVQRPAASAAPAPIAKPQKMAQPQPRKRSLFGRSAPAPGGYGGNDMNNDMNMAKGGAVKKALPMRGSRTATNMAKGGSVKKGKK